MTLIGNIEETRVDKSLISPIFTDPIPTMIQTNEEPSNNTDTKELPESSHLIPYDVHTCPLAPDRALSLG